MNLPSMSSSETDTLSEARPPVGRRERTVILSITAAFALLLTMWSAITPMFDAPDERAHLNSAIRLAVGDGWPPPGEARMYWSVREISKDGSGAVTPRDERQTFAELTEMYPGLRENGIDQMSQHPPLYYAIGGALLNAIGFENLRWDLSVMALRLLDVLFVLPLPLLIWATVRRITRRPRVAIVAASALFAVPQLAFIGAAVGNDSLVMLLGGVIVYLMSRVLTGDARWRTLVALGVALGLLLFTKGTGLPAIPFVGLGVILAGGAAATIRQRVLRSFVTLLIAFAIGGWWWLRNLLVYGDIQPSGLAGVRPAVPWPDGEGPAIHIYLDTVWDGFSGSFWGRFGALEYPVSPILTDILTVSSLALVILFAFRRGPWRRTSWLLVVLPVTVLLLFMVNTFRIYAKTQAIYGIQGRYLFVAVVALIALVALASLNAFTTDRARRTVGRLTVVGAPIVAVYGLWVAYSGFYEGTRIRIRVEALRHWALTSPFGTRGLLAVGVLLVIVLVLSIVLALRFIDRPVIDRALAVEEGSR